MLFILEEETKLSTISLCFHLTLFHDPGCIHQFVDFFILLFICDILYCLLFYCHSVYFNLLCLDLISTIPEIQCYIDAIVSRCLLRFFSPFIQLKNAEISRLFFISTLLAIFVYCILKTDCYYTSE